MRYSVMIPTCEPNELLRLTLESVLRQARGRSDMQIAVVDDASVRADVPAIIRSVPGGDRVDYHPSGQRLGLGGNWNRAIELAAGELVHILHQDDSVADRFYARMAHAFKARPSIGMAFCRTRIVDATGNHLKTNSRLAWRAGVLRNWLPRISERQRVQTPAVVVPRAVYHKLGGFRRDLLQAVDWEMWVRIAARFEVWYEPCVLATFRRHGVSESSRLLSRDAVWDDIAQAIRINAQTMPDSLREGVVNRSARWYAGSALRCARKQSAVGNSELAWQSVHGAQQLLKLCSSQPMRQRLERRIERLQKVLPTAKCRAA